MPVVREFVDWNAPLLPAAADSLIRRYANGNQLDMSNVRVVVNGQRAARRLLEILVQKAQSRWPSLIPPRFSTQQQFPEVLYPRKKQLADDLTQLLVWRKALTSIQPRFLKDALPHLPDDEAVPAWMALCETLRRQHNELASESMNFDDLSKKLSKAGNLPEAARWEALNRIQKSYLNHMDTLDLWDKQAARLFAVRNSECRTNEDIILVGTMDLDQIVRQMIVQVADRVTVMIHAPLSEASRFDEYGCMIPEHWTSQLLNIPFEETRIADNPTDQARHVLHELAALNGQFRADDITLGIADEDFISTLQQALEDGSVKSRWQIGMPVSRSRPWKLLHAICQHLNSARNGLPGDFDSLADLVRHPDAVDWISIRLAGISPHYNGLDWITELDLYQSDHLQTTPGIMLGEPSRKKTVTDVLFIVNQLLELLLPPGTLLAVPEKMAPEKTTPTKNKTKAAAARQKQLNFGDGESDASFSLVGQLGKKRPLSQWVSGCIRVLSALYHGRPIQPDSLPDRGLQHCITSILDLMESLRRVPDPVIPRCSAAQAIQLVLSQIASKSVPPDDDPEAIDILHWSDLTMDDAPVLILTGFNEGNIPESSTSDVFLPNSFRSSLGLTDNDRKLARDICAMTAIRHSRKKVVLIAGKTDVKGNPQTPSRLWFSAEPKSLAERVRRFYGSNSSKEFSIDTDTSETAASLDSLNRRGHRRLSGFTVPEPKLVRPRKVPVEISVTAFREYINCPYRYFLNRELRLRSVDNQVRELSGAAFGNLIHDVLKSFGESKHRDSSSASKIEAYLLKELEVQASKHFGHLQSATIAVQLKMAEDRLVEFSKWQAETSAEGWRIHSIEINGRCDGLSDLKKRRYALVGRIDRIDQWKDSELFRVLDYKTSDSPQEPHKSHKQGEQWIDLQLPLYRTLVREAGITGKLQLGYIHLPGDLSKVGPSMAEWTDQELDEADRFSREIATDIIDLKIDRVEPGDPAMPSDFAAICQETVIDRNIPWLSSNDASSADLQ
ncbi:MAG: PD-(D/E)XK nuclease family protein [Planctomyces sp.]|nr:PD-(D/E)XK nuclease family protein [Planctomyces sp.]